MNQTKQILVTGVLCDSGERLCVFSRQIDLFDRASQGKMESVPAIAKEVRVNVSRVPALGLQLVDHLVDRSRVALENRG